MPFSSSPVFILDGGLGTTLVDHFSCKFDDTNCLWSSQLLLTEAGVRILQKCHRAFVDAGADLILTATYQASTLNFARFLVGIGEVKYKNYVDNQNKIENLTNVQRDPRSGASPAKLNSQIKPENRIINLEVCLAAEEYMRNAVNLARISFGEKKGKVALSLGAAGACLNPSQEYTGNYAGSEIGISVSSIRMWHLERLKVFTRGDSKDVNNQPWESNCWMGVDLVAFETLPLLVEIIAVREAMKQIHDESKSENIIARKDFWISCVFPGENYCLPDGSRINEVIRAMLGTRDNAEIPMAVGINCTNIVKLEHLIESYEDTVREMITKEEIQDWPSLVVYPDGTNGEVYNTTTHEWEIKENSNSYSVSILIEGFDPFPP